MWTSTLDLKLDRVLLLRLLGLVYPRIYSSSLSPLRVANVPRSALPAASWVRVRNRLAGICGSDLHLVHADADVRTSVAALPHYNHIYPGHEVVGEVIEIGQDVHHLRVGDRVVLQYGPNCLSSGTKPVCRACAVENYNLCEYGSSLGPQPIGGGWSEEMLLHEQQLFRLPTEMSDEQGVLLEPTAVALHGVLRYLPQADDNVLIIGAGTIGLLTLQILHALVPKARISMFARYPFQIEHATRLGADHIIYPIDPYASVQRATQSHLYKGILGNRTLTGGYDVIYDTVGQQKTLHHALRWLRAQGTMVLIGLSLHMMHIDLTPLWHQEINLLGSLSHGRETWPSGSLTDLLGTPSDRSTFSVAAELIQQKCIKPEELITHRFALDKYQDALKAAKYKKNTQSIKVLFDYALLPASAVPNVRASARSHRPALSQPQGDAFMEELLKAQNATDPHQDPEQEAIPQSNIAQQTLPPKILDTPPQVFAKESLQTILSGQDLNQDDTDEDTDPAIPVIKRPLYNSHVGSRVIVSSPQTPIPPAIEPTPVLVVEIPEPKTDESEAKSLSVQPMLEPQQAEVASEFLTSTGDSLLEVPAEPLANEEEPISAFSETTDMISTDNTLLEVPAELPANEEESILPIPEIVGMNALTEEQLPTQTVLDHLFDADASSMPAFLAELSNFSNPVIPETSIDNGDAPTLPHISATILPIEDVEALILPEATETAQPIADVEASILSEATEVAPPIEDAEAPMLPETSTTAQPIEEVEAPILPEATEVAQPIEDAEAPMLPETSTTVQPIEEVEAPILPEATETAQPIEDAEVPVLPETSATAQPIGDAEVSVLPETSANALPMEEVEAPILPEATETALPVDSPDQVIPDQTDTNSALSKPRTKKKSKPSQLPQAAAAINGGGQHEKKPTEEKLTQAAQIEQVAVPSTQEQVATDTDGNADAPNQP